MIENLNIMRNLFLLLAISVVFMSCEEDFDLLTEYTDQTVIYSFLEHKDPWIPTRDTHFVVVNKAFLGEANVYDMAAVADSVNYKNYDEIEVTLQRIKNINPDSDTLDSKIYLEYTKHYKDSGAFSRDNNIVFYTTKNLMNYQDMNIYPFPNPDESYYYKLSVKKPGQKEVYATTKMIRGLHEGRPLDLPPSNRYIDMVSTVPNFTYKVEFQSNVDARLYQFKIRVYYYEKRTDGHIYLDYVDYNHPLLATTNKVQAKPEELQVNVVPLAFFSSIQRALSDTSGVEWRIPKMLSKSGLTESHALMFALGSQETYVYNQVTQPSFGIVQERPTYTNITNGLGLFTSKWNYKRGNFKLRGRTIDSLALGSVTKDLKFKGYAFAATQNSLINSSDVIKRYKSHQNQ